MFRPYFIVSLTFVILSSLFISFALGEHSLEVYRLIQYEKDGQPIGSFRTSLNLLATTETKTSGTLSKYLAVINASDMDISRLKEIINRNVDGVLFILDNEDMSDNQLSNWQQVEKYLISQSFEIPIYFTFFNDDVAQMMNDLSDDNSQQTSKSFLGSDSWRFVVATKDGAQVKKVKVKNIQGTLQGRSKSDSRTIVVTTKYDNHHIVPSLSIDQGSNIISILEVARLFNKLYKDPRSQSNYNIIFLLEGAGEMNYQGTTHWLENLEESIIENIDFVLCLDTFLESDKLYLHVSRSTKNPKVKAMYDLFEESAKENNIELNVIRKKINLAEEFRFQHQAFAVKKLFAATLSSLPESSFNESLFSKKKQLDLNGLRKVTLFISQVLAKIVYPVNINMNELFKGEYDIDESHIIAWQSLFMSEPRMLPFMGMNDSAITTLSLSQHFESIFKEHLIQDFEVEPKTIFYDKTTVKLQAYRAKPALFDVIITLAIISYIGAFYTYLNGITDTMNSIKNIFKK